MANSWLNQGVKLLCLLVLLRKTSLLWCPTWLCHSGSVAKCDNFLPLQALVFLATLATLALRFLRAERGARLRRLAMIKCEEVMSFFIAFIAFRMRSQLQLLWRHCCYQFDEWRRDILPHLNSWVLSKTLLLILNMYEVMTTHSDSHLGRTPIQTPPVIRGQSKAFSKVSISIFMIRYLVQVLHDTVGSDMLPNNAIRTHSNSFH